MRHAWSARAWLDQKSSQSEWSLSALADQLSQHPCFRIPSFCCQRPAPLRNCWSGWDMSEPWAMDDPWFSDCQSHHACQPAIVSATDCCRPVWLPTASTLVDNPHGSWWWQVHIQKLSRFTSYITRFGRCNQHQWWAPMMNIFHHLDIETTCKKPWPTQLITLVSSASWMPKQGRRLQNPPSGRVCRLIIIYS